MNRTEHKMPARTDTRNGGAEMKNVAHAGVTIATQSFGTAGDPAILLIMGATASMLSWPDEFCAGLAARGYFVIRFDHRDTGQSTTVPPGSADYDVEDMVADAVAILDAYDLERAHLLGMSLGGLISQMVALLHPKRVISLTLLASAPLGWDGLPLPHIDPAFLEHFNELGTLDWSDRESVIRFLLRSEELCAGTGHNFDGQRQRARIEVILARTDSIASIFNHGSLKAREDWTGRFRDIGCPVLVVHGEEDPILPVENGKALATGIEDAELLLLPGIGHELPPLAIPVILEHLALHLQQSNGTVPR
ncbi:alpha/beta fold hydrolase [Nitratireductor rhodophyticola]|uniref:alpha/beta fold hydrolase n=2 Tax=Nitratireductor rhodophyticola TaxID=2854036 RepID=UPI002EA449C6|nr:alpha/beta hydrolase [Pseudomonadota bacterium]